MVEQIHWFINRPYGFDDHSRFRYGEGGQKAISPCEPIQDKDLCLGIVENSNLQTSRLRIVDKDRTIIKVSIPATNETVELAMPGKSAFIILQPNLCDKAFIHETVSVVLNNRAGRQDHVHVATVQEIEDAGWVPYYAPLQLKPILNHVRLVAKCTIFEGTDPTMDDVERLKSAFKIIPNLHG